MYCVVDMIWGTLQETPDNNNNNSLPEDPQRLQTATRLRIFLGTLMRNITLANWTDNGLVVGRISARESEFIIRKTASNPAFSHSVHPKRFITQPLLQHDGTKHIGEELQRNDLKRKKERQSPYFPEIPVFGNPCFPVVTFFWRPCF